MLNSDKFEEYNSLYSEDDESFYIGNHIVGLGFVESDDNNWGSILSALAGASCESSILFVSTRYHDNIHAHKHSIGGDELVDTMRYYELIRLMDVQASEEENAPVL